MKKNIMEAFSISEISAVDRPAQSHAVMAIMKRHNARVNKVQEDEPYWKRDFTDQQRQDAADAGEALPDGSYPIKNKSDLSNAIQAFGRAKNKAQVKRHIISRARSLDAVSSLPEDWGVTKASADDIAKRVDLAAVFTKRWIDPADGAVSFASVLQNSMDADRYSDVMQEASPLISSLDTSLRSIVADPNPDAPTKQTMLRSTVEDFLAALRAKWPDVEDALHSAMDDSDVGTTGVNKTMNPTEAEIAAALAKASLSADEKAHAGKLSGKAKMDFLGMSKDERKGEMDKATKAASDDADTKKALDETKKALVAKDSELAKVNAALADALAKAGMTDDEKKHHAGLSGKDATDFATASHDDRSKMMATKRAGDEVVKIDGMEIRKSEVGDKQFAVFKAQQKRIDDVEKRNADEIEKRETVEFTKRAETEMAGLPGSLVEKVDVLRQIAKLPDGVKATLGTMFKAAGATAKLALDRFGSTKGSEATLNKGAGVAFDKIVSDIAKRDDIPRTQAMTKARNENPDAYAAAFPENLPN